MDDTRGKVIGDHQINGQLFYDGRPQGRAFYAKTEKEIIEMAKAMRDEYMEEFGGFPCYLYQNSNLWEVRIYI